MTDKKALEDIILYLNATEPKGLYCENIEAIKQDLERLEKLEKEKQELKEENSRFKKVIDFLKLNFNISLDSKLRIDDGSVNPHSNGRFFRDEISYKAFENIRRLLNAF